METIPFARRAAARRFHCVACVLLLLGAWSVRADSHTYDALGRLTQTAQPGGQATTYSYDENGNIVAVASVTVVVSAEKAGTWQVEYTAAAGARPSIAGEMAFLDSSSDAQRTFVPMSIAAPVRAGDDFVVRYRRPVGGRQAFRAEFSSDRKRWTSQPAIVSTTVTGRTDDWEEVTVRAKPASPHAAVGVFRFVPVSA